MNTWHATHDEYARHTDTHMSLTGDATAPPWGGGHIHWAKKLRSQSECVSGPRLPKSRCVVAARRGFGRGIEGYATQAVASPPSPRMYCGGGSYANKCEHTQSRRPGRCQCVREKGPGAADGDCEALQRVVAVRRTRPASCPRAVATCDWQVPHGVQQPHTSCGAGTCRTGIKPSRVARVAWRR